MIWHDTAEKYIGQWLENFQNGMGIHIWYEAKGEQKYLRNRYVGEWRNGFRHGYGVFFYANGGKYEGMWEQNYKNGFGIFTFHDGSQFSGKFTMDRMDYNNAGYLTGANATRNSNLPQNNNISFKLGVSGIKGAGKGKDLKTIRDDEEDERNTKRPKDTKEKKDEKSEKKPTKKNKTVEILKEVNIETNRTVSNAKINDFKKPDIKEVSVDPDKTKVINDSKKQESRTITNQKVNDSKKIDKKETSIDPKKTLKSEETKKTEIKSKPSNIKENKVNSNQINEEGNQLKINVAKINETAIKKDNLQEQTNRKISNDQAVQIKNDKNIKELSDNIPTRVLSPPDKNDDPDKKTSVFSTKTVKESEQNPFKTLLDITDLIETEPELESGLKDVENVLLRYLSDMKAWYKFYTNKDSNSDGNDSNIKENKASTNQVNDKEINETVLDNNDIGFAMEMKDLWKFIRDSNIISLDFSLASFNRIYFRGPKNYIEMYLCPDEIKLYSKEYYEYIYNMIQKSKDDFMFKNREKFLNPLNTYLNQGQDFSNLLFKPSEIEINVDIHYKKNVILLRHFFESIVRIAYLKYFQSNESLYKKIRNLIDNFIKLNQNLKKIAKKSNTHDSSLNSTLILDMKSKIFELTFDIFIREHDSKLKTIFHNLISKSTNSFRKLDLTITNKIFFNFLIQRSSLFQNLLDKFKFVELITIYHKEKMIITEDNKQSNQVIIYIDTLFDCEIIYYEVCELIFFCCKKYFKDKSINEKKERETFLELLNHFVSISSKAESVFNINEKFVYYYPKLANHRKYEAIIEADKQRRLLEDRKRMEIKRLEYERNMLGLEDINILPHDEIDEIEDGKSQNSNDD